MGRFRKFFLGEDSEHKLSPVDPETDRVVAEMPIVAREPEGGAYRVAVGEGAVWAQSVRGSPFKVDPATNEVVAEVDLGDYSSDLAVYGGSVGATAQVSVGTRLFRVDPRTGEEVEATTLKDFATNTMEVAVGSGSVWVASTSSEAGVVLRVDPETNRVVDRIPVGSPTGLAFGHGSVWVTSSGSGTLSRVDPRTGEVAEEIEVGRGALDVAVDDGSETVWVASGSFFSMENPEHHKLSRVDAATDRVVAQIPIAARRPEGGAQSVTVGEGAVWAQSVRGKLFVIDPATNELVAAVPLGDYSSDLAVYGGAVWATAQIYVGTRLFRVDPRTARVIASEHGPDPAEGGYGGLVAGGGYVWFGSGDGLARVAP